MDEVPAVVEACEGLKGTIAGIVIMAAAGAGLAAELITMWPAIILFAFGAFAVIPKRFYAFYTLIKDQLSRLRK